MTNYEYLVIQWGGHDRPVAQREQLDTLGAQGWELVSVSLQTAGHSPIVHAYLKRPLAKGKR